MTRYSHLTRLLPLGALAAAGVMVLSAAPAGATLVCQAGHTPSPTSPYCTNVPPTATTNDATNVKPKRATLNGVAGPNVVGGDPTSYFFQWGPTKAYGNETPTGTIGSCPKGITSPSPYCTTPKTQAVSFDISSLTPCTNYHFQLFASNPDAATPVNGGDKKFTTAFAPPLTKVTSPNQVKSGHRFKVRFTLRYVATVKIVFSKKNGRLVQAFRYVALPPGHYTQPIVAPRQTGNYVVEVIAKLNCGKQTVVKPLRVH